MSSSGWEVEMERKYMVPSGGLKPDIVAVHPDGSAVILDAQVVNATNLQRTWREKKRKYDRQDLWQAISERTGVAANNIRVAALTVSWRGVWCGRSATELRDLGISAGVLRGVTTRVLLGTYLNWWTFMRRTSLYPRHSSHRPSSSSFPSRTGVG